MIPIHLYLGNAVQIAMMEERWSNMEAQKSNSYVNGAAKPDLGGGVTGQYMARMTQYYTEGNQVKPRKPDSTNSS